jgi:PAS domain S-box-containing protein
VGERDQSFVSGLDDALTAAKAENDQLRISEIRYRRLFEAAEDGVLLIDPETRKITDANPFMTKLLDYSREQLVGKELFEIGLLRDEAVSQKMMLELKATGQVRYEDLPLQSKEGQHQQVEVVANVYDENGRAVIQCNIRDITMRKKRDRHNKLLIGEVNHRARNLLAVVLAIARQTARHADPATFVELLSERIGGLAASQDLLVENNWQGVELADLVKAQLGHFKDLFGTRVIIDGTPARLKPVAAQSIGMVLHELTTNAGKYGALSNTEGIARISWQIAQGKGSFSMLWVENGGPEVTPPTHKGFGQMVIAEMVEDTLEGHTEISYRPDGLSWQLSAPIAKVLDSGATRSVLVK